MSRYNEAIGDLLRYNVAMEPRKRSSFNKNHSHTTTFDSGYLVPIMWDRVLPGDEKKIRYSGLARMTTPLHPTMDDANLDVWCFYVPDRLWWTHAKEFYGENKDASFNPDGEYVMPYLKPSQYMVMDSELKDVSGYDPTLGIGSLNDYFGFPRNKNAMTMFSSTLDNDPEFRVTAGLHRCYQLIWNEWFRNSSVQPALQLNDGDNVTEAEWNVIKLIRKVNKRPDFYTSLLREPQAGDDVMLPLGEWAPVVTRDVNTDDVSLSSYPMNFRGSSGGSYNFYDILGYRTSTMSNQIELMGSERDGTLDGQTPLVPNNLWANLTDATSATINNLRAAITVQHLLEVDSIAGKRYQQILQAHFGVFTPDATLQRPELLGATRTPVGIRQVLQTSATVEGSPLGDTAAFSLTNVTNEWICNKAFTEPGFIMVVAAVRPSISYSQYLDPLLTKLNRYDHYWPVFDNLGNQPLYRYNVVMSGKDGFCTPAELKQVFGYMEAWTEYRVKQNRVSGLFRPDTPGSLSSWNYSVDLPYNSTLNSDFIEVDPQLIERTLAVQNEPQFLLDSYFEYTDIKNMSVHSVPGLTRL